MSDDENTPGEDAFEAMLARTFGARMKADEALCKELWSALANVNWYHPTSKQEYSSSFRYAGGLIARIRGEGNYMDWYCSGPYALITDEIRRTFKKEGWIADDLSEICEAPGCLRDAGCGWPHPSGYRRTCGEHMRDRSWLPAPSEAVAEVEAEEQGSARLRAEEPLHSPPRGKI